MKVVVEFFKRLVDGFLLPVVSAFLNEKKANRPAIEQGSAGNQ